MGCHKKVPRPHDPRATRPEADQMPSKPAAKIRTGASCSAQVHARQTLGDESEGIVIEFQHTAHCPAGARLGRRNVPCSLTLCAAGHPDARYMQGYQRLKHDTPCRHRRRARGRVGPRDFFVLPQCVPDFCSVTRTCVIDQLPSMIESTFPSVPPFPLPTHSQPATEQSSTIWYARLLLLLLLLRAYAHEHPATSYRRSVDL